MPDHGAVEAVAGGGGPAHEVAELVGLGNVALSRKG